MVIYFAANLYSTIDNVYIGLSRLDIKLYILIYIYIVYTRFRHVDTPYTYCFGGIPTLLVRICILYIYIFIPFKMSTMMRRFRKTLHGSLL